MCEMNRRIKTHNGRLKNGIWFNPSQNRLTYDGVNIFLNISCRNQMAFVINLWQNLSIILQPFWRMSSIVCLFMVNSLLGFFSVPFFLFFSAFKKRRSKETHNVCLSFCSAQTSSRVLWSCFKIRQNRFKFQKIYGTLFFRLGFFCCSFFLIHAT